MADQLPLNGFYQDESRKQSARTCTNFMPVPGDPGDLSPYSLYSTTGILNGVPLQNLVDEVAYWRSTENNLNTICATASSGISSPVFTVPVVLTNGVDKSITEASYTSIGTESFWNLKTISVQPVADFFVMAASFESLLNGDSFGTVIWTWDGTAWSSGTRIFESTGASERKQINISDAAYLNGFFLYLNPVVRYDGQKISDFSNRVYYSGVLDPESVGDLSFISSVSQVGNLIGMEAVGNRLYVFSETEMSVFAPNGNSTDINVPFVEQLNSGRQIGLSGNRAKTVFGDSIYMIGSVEGRRRFVRVQNGTPQIISTKEIDYLLERSGLNDPRVFEFQDQGRSIIAFSFDDHTLCLDVITGEYHRRSTDGGRWGCVFQSPDGVFISNNAPIGDENRGSRAAMSDHSVGTEYGEIVKRECITSHFNSNGMTNRLSEVAIQADIDYTNYTDQYSNPNMGLSVSSDFGASYSQESFQQFGPLGVFDRLMRWLGLGVFRQSFTIKLRTSNPYPHRVIKMLARLKKGRRRI